MPRPAGMPFAPAARVPDDMRRGLVHGFGPASTLQSWHTLLVLQLVAELLLRPYGP